jgi:hypothetical protein
MDCPDGSETGTDRGPVRVTRARGLHPLHAEARIRQVPTTARELCEVGYAGFGDTCPLCTRPLPRTSGGQRGSAEMFHRTRVGGTVRTRTCPNCNGRGSLAESDLVRWWAKEYLARFETRGLPGSGVGGDVLLRGTMDGKFALVVSGAPAAGVRDVFSTAGVTDGVTATFVLPTGGWRVALLKAAYLSACVHLGEVPSTPDAE